MKACNYFRHFLMVINNCICTAVYVSNFFRIVSVLTLFFCLHLFVIPQLQEEETHILQDTPSQPTDDNPVCVGKPFIFPHTRSRPPLLPSMPTLPEEEEDSPEEMDSSSSSPTTVSTKADVVWNEKSHHRQIMVQNKSYIHNKHKLEIREL